MTDMTPKPEEAGQSAAELMREACALHLEAHSNSPNYGGRFLRALAKELRDMPLPEAPQDGKPPLTFEEWWNKHGEFIRAGGGDYERSFAWGAWDYLTKLAAATHGEPPAESPTGILIYEFTNEDGEKTFDRWLFEKSTALPLADGAQATMHELFDGSDPSLIERERALFEADAGSYEFDLTRHQCAVPEPWAEYANEDTGHRWAGWLAALSSRSPQ